MDFEEVLAAVKPFGRFQKRFFAMTLFVIFPTAIIDIMFAFTQYETSFHCALPDWINASKDSDDYEKFVDLLIPQERDSYGVSGRSQCEMYKVTENMAANETTKVYSTSDKIQCPFGYHFADLNTATAEFMMVCEDSWKGALAVTLYMIGMGLAAFSGYFSDKYAQENIQTLHGCILSKVASVLELVYATCLGIAKRFGRRPIFLCFKSAQVLLSGLLSLSWDYNSYAVFSLLIGLSAMVTYAVAFVLATEMLGIKKRFQIGIAVCLSYSLGYLASPLIGFLLPNWRWFLRANFFLGLLYIPLYWYFPESLRWYLVGKKEKESKALLQEIAKLNEIKIDVDSVYERFQKFQANKEDLEKNLINSTLPKEETSYLLQCKVSTMRLRYMIMCLAWFASSMIYFAISLYPAYLSGDRLLNILYTGLAEIPAVVVAYFLPQYCGRVKSTSLLYILCGFSCAASPFLKKVNATLVTVLILISKTTVTAAFDLIYVITSEVSPTLVRSTSLGVASMCARVGGIVMPFLMLAGEGVHDFVPFFSMGTVSIVAGFLYLIFIPETGSVAMPDTLQMALNNKSLYDRKFRKSRRVVEIDLQDSSTSNGKAKESEAFITQQCQMPESEIQKSQVHIRST